MARSVPRYGIGTYSRRRQNPRLPPRTTSRITAAAAAAAEPTTTTIAAAAAAAAAAGSGIPTVRARFGLGIAEVGAGHRGVTAVHPHPPQTPTSGGVGFEQGGPTLAVAGHVGIQHGVAALVGERLPGPTARHAAQRRGVRSDVAGGRLRGGGKSWRCLSRKEACDVRMARKSA